MFPPGEFLKEELDARGWTQTDLAEILGRPLRLVNEIIAVKRGITPETAKGLADALGTTAEFWLNLESSYQLSRVPPDQSDKVARRARLYSKAPIKEIVRRNWIEHSENMDVLERRILDFFELSSLDEEPAFPLAARKSTSYESFTSAQWAWLFRAKQLAPAVAVGAFSRSRLKSLIAELRALLGSPEDVRHVPRLLAEAGLRLLIIEPLQGTRIDGACFWPADGAPVVVLSLRYDRIDSFWHTLMHELGHVRKQDGLLDVDVVGEGSQNISEKPENEQGADQFAVETLIPPQELDDFIVRVKPLYSTLKIQGFANVLKVHPGIVVGQLQHRGEISYAQHRKLLAPVRHIITQSALTDGWGSILPASIS